MKICAFTKTYEGRCVLELPDMELECGKIYAVIGANGSGKSTMARILAGTIRPDQKCMVTEAGAEIGYMPQKSFPFQMSVIKNLLVACGDTNENREKAAHYIKELELEGLANEKAHRLSGGETARMAIARVMMENCRMLILDEPTAAMDIKSTLTAEALIKEYRDRTGACVVLVTHSLAQALRISDNTLFLCEGKLCEFGKSEDVIRRPQKEETRRFIEFYGV
ncbi:MAG: ATP-binding cassette domain-containing protein [Anaerovoracaceae bacterium]|nr:ATP-binding cassette domain-containing protein [Bacillota bacterium]MDY3954332.1 ATP-binding cassette domain-containing protein [Anaerovoracaceae bacterium]